MTRTCSMEGCPEPRKARGLCNKHYKRWATHGDPTFVTPPKAYPKYGADHHAWVDRPSVAALHGRIRRARGRAKDHLCAECGESAAEWAYDHSDPDEYLAEKNGRMVPCSTDMDRYRPLCKPCHRRADYKGWGRDAKGRFV